jgi:hypothetical protein
VLLSIYLCVIAILFISFRGRELPLSRAAGLGVRAVVHGPTAPVPRALAVRLLPVAVVFRRARLALGLVAGRRLWTGFLGLRLLLRDLLLLDRDRSVSGRVGE